MIAKTSPIYLLRFIQLVAAICLLATAQAQPLNFHQLTVQQGLSQNSVYAICFDPSGYMWAGTADGLNRYNGYEFKTYRSGVLYNTTINALAASEDGRIWVGGINGLEVFDPVTETSVLLWKGTVINKEITWYEDRPHHRMLAFVRYKGLFEFDLTSLKFKSWEHPSVQSFINHSYNLSVLQGNDASHVWVFPRGYVSFQIDLNSRQIDSIPILPEHESLMSSVSEWGPDHWIFTSFAAGKAWLVKYNHQTQQIEKRKQVQIGLRDPFFSSTCYLPESGRILVSDFDRGLLFFDTSFHETAQYPVSAILDKTSKTLVFQCLALHDNMLWLGSDPNGISWCDLTPARFALYQYKESRYAPIVKGIFTDRNKRLYSCLLYNGVEVFDPNGNYIRELEPIAEGHQKPLSFQAFNSVFDGGNQMIFIHCFNYYGYYDPVSGKTEDRLQELQHLLNPKGVVDWNNSYHVSTYAGPHQVLTGWKNQVCRVDFSSSKLQIQLLDTVNNYITALHWMNDSSWIAGTLNGCYWHRGKLMKPIRDLNGYYVKQISTDARKKIWICTTAGVFVLDESGRILRHLTVADGLPNEFVYAAMPTKNSMWLSTNRGLSEWMIDFSTHRNYDYRDGLQSNEFNSGAYWKDAEGRLYFGGINGISQVNPTAAIQRTPSFKIAITRVTVNDSVMLHDQTGLCELGRELQFGQNRISVQYSALFPGVNDRVHYRYRLEGQEAVWTDAGTNRELRFAQLAPGTYHLKIQASMNGTDWAEHEAGIQFKIRPPFWKTNGFTLLVLVAITGMIWWIFSLRNRQMQRKQLQEQQLRQQLEEERQRISRDLHDNIGAYASALMNNVDQLKRYPQIPDTSLLTMQENAAHLLGSLRETIWVLNNRSVSVRDFVGTIKNNYFKLLRNYEAIDFSSEERADPSRNIAATKAIHLNSILQEGFQNSMKHAGSCKVLFKTYETEGRLVFALQDDGCGFASDKSGIGHGLENMRWRANQAGYTLEITSHPGSGTLLLLTEIKSTP